MKKLTDKIKYGNPPVWTLIAADLLLACLAVFCFALFSGMLPWLQLPGAQMAESPAAAPSPAVVGAGTAESKKPWKFEKLLSEKPVRTDKSYSDSGIYIDVEKIEGIPGVTECPYYLADIYIKDMSRLKGEFGAGKFRPALSKPMEQFARETKAVLATNGDFYNMQMGSCVLRNGVLYRESSQDMDLFAVYSDGSARAFPAGELSSAGEYSKALENAWQVWAFGPSLLDGEGELRADLSKTVTAKIAGRNPRTGIGYFEPGHFCLVVTEGRSGLSQGMTLEQFAGIFSGLGCAAAYNLDGGGSSCMYFGGKVLNSSYRGRQLPDIIALTEN